MSRLRGYLPIFDNKNLDVHLGGKVGQKGKKVHEFHFRLKIYPHHYFHATWALLEDFENFAHFDHISYLTFSHFPTPQSGYDPFGPKIWIANTSIWPLEHSWAENNGVDKSFGPHKWGLKTKNFRFFDFRHLMSHRGKGYHISEKN